MEGLRRGCACLSIPRVRELLRDPPPPPEGTKGAAECVSCLFIVGLKRPRSREPRDGFPGSGGLNLSPSLHQASEGPREPAKAKVGREHHGVLASHAGRYPTWNWPGLYQLWAAAAQAVAVRQGQQHHCGGRRRPRKTAPRAARGPAPPRHHRERHAAPHAPRHRLEEVEQPVLVRRKAARVANSNLRLD